MSTELTKQDKRIVRQKMLAAGLISPGARSRFEFIGSGWGGKAYKYHGFVVKKTDEDYEIDGALKAIQLKQAQDAPEKLRNMIADYFIVDTENKLLVLELLDTKSIRSDFQNQIFRRKFYKYSYQLEAIGLEDCHSDNCGYDAQGQLKFFDFRWFAEDD